MDSSRMVGVMCTTLVVFVLAAAFAEGKGDQGTPFLEAEVPRQEYYCEDDFKLSGVYCVKTIEKAASRVCEFGLPEGSVCVEVYPAVRECSPGFSVQGEKCERMDSSLPSAKCPTEYLLDGPRCIRQRPLPKVCPAGSRPVGPTNADACEVRYPAESRCPPGFKKQTNSVSTNYKGISKYGASHGGKSGNYHGNLGGKYSSKVKKYAGRYESSKHGSKYEDSKHVDEYDGGDYCMKEESTAPIEVCPEGQELDAEMSECVLLTLIEPKCALGTSEQPNGQCLLEKPAVARCEAGAALQEGGAHSYQSVTKRKQFAYQSKGQYQQASCLMKEQVAPVLQCEDGFRPGPGRSCERVERTKAACPAGTVERGERCALLSVATPDCPSEFGVALKADGSFVCRKAVRLSPRSTCDEGYDVEDENCVKTLPGRMVCPPNSYEEDGLCFAEILPTEWCEDGFKLGWGRCKMVERVQARATCTKDFSMSSKEGYCEKSKVCEPISMCRKGYKEGNKCVEYRPIEPMVSCPGGFVQEWTGNTLRCVQELPKDCSTVEYKVVCRSVPACFDKDCPEQHSKYSKDAEPHKSSSKPAHSYRSKHMKEVCEKQAVPTKRECGRRITADVIKTCPPDAVPQGKECMEALYTAPNMQCPMGEYDPSRNLCVKTWKKAAEYSCPDGFEQSYGDYRRKRTFSKKTEQAVCIRTHDVSAGLQCEDGWNLDTSNRCRKQVEHVCEDGICESKFAVLANFQCPEMHELTQDEEGRRFCLRNELVRPNYRCPRGMAVEGAKCVEYKEKFCTDGARIGDACEKLIQGRVYDVCMEGFNLVNRGEKVCIRLYSVDPEYLCDEDGWELNGDKCLTFERKTCPGGECEVVEKQRSTLQCPDGDWEEHKEYAHSVDWRQTDYAHGFQGKNKKSSRGEPRLVCKRTSFAELEHYCSKGELGERGTCTKYLEKACGRKGCTLMEELAPSYVCADGSRPEPGYDGYSDYGTVPKCSTVYYEDVSYRCSKGEMDAGGKSCRKIMNTKLVCPVSFTQRGETCFKELAKTPEIRYMSY